jgi:preprotein translocase subunit SecG
VTGKGDAMSGGGGSVRTTFKGKASFDDYMSRLTLILGAAFFVLMLLIDGISNRMHNAAGVNVQAPAANAPASTAGGAAPATTTGGSAPATAPSNPATTPPPTSPPAGAPAKH